MVGLSFPATVALDAQGQLEVLARGKDGALWLIQQTAPNNGWSAWMSLGTPPGLTLGRPPAIGTNADGRLEVFVQGSDGALWHIWQVDTQGGGWSGWDSLGGVIRSIPGVGRNGDGRLEIFALGTDSAVWHIWQTAPNNGWSGWNSLGGTGKSFVVIALNHAGALNNRLEIFVIGNDFPTPHMYHLWQVTPGGGWSPWTSLGGWISPDPSVGQNQDGHLEVFAIGNDVFSGTNVTHSWQTPPGATTWSGFSSMGNPPPGAISPQVASNQDQRLEVFGVGTDNNVWHIWQTAPNNGWSGWGSLGIPGPGTNFLLAIGNNQDGRIELFAIGTDSNLWHCWQTAPNNGWSDWESLGSP
jgi:hypothetical protein